MSFRLDDKVAVVAGAAGGIGSATARRMAEAGARVVAGDINLEGAQVVVDSIVDAGGTAVAVRYDQADEDSTNGLMDGALAAFGKIDLLHVNAVDPRMAVYDTDLLALDQKTWEKIVSVDLIGYANVLRRGIPHLLGTGDGRIVCTSSGASRQGLPNLPAYSACKGGVEALVRHVAARWGKDGIRCNGICPLAITPTAERHMGPEGVAEMLSRTPSTRLGRASDTAQVVMFLMSDEAFYVSGQIINVNGGATFH